MTDSQLTTIDVVEAESNFDVASPLSPDPFKLRAGLTTEAQLTVLRQRTKSRKAKETVKYHQRQNDASISIRRTAAFIHPLGPRH
jgi:hypothetical protein